VRVDKICSPSPPPSPARGEGDNGLSPYRRFVVPFQLKSIGRGKAQKGPVKHPIPHIVVETSPPINPLLNPLRKMGVAEDDDLKPFQKFLMGKSPEGWGGSWLFFVMILLITHVT